MKKPKLIFSIIFLTSIIFVISNVFFKDENKENYFINNTLAIRVNIDDTGSSIKYEVGFPEKSIYGHVMSSNNCDNNSAYFKGYHTIKNTNDGKGYLGCIYENLGSYKPTVKCPTGYTSTRMAVTRIADKKSVTAYVCKSNFDYQAKYDTTKTYANVPAGGCEDKYGFVNRMQVAYDDLSKAYYACVYASKNTTPLVNCADGYKSSLLEGKKVGATSYDYSVYICEKKEESKEEENPTPTPGTSGGEGSPSSGNESNPNVGDGVGGSISEEGTFTPNASDPRLDYDDPCASDERGIRSTIIFIGKILNVSFYAIPLIIIVLGMIDFVKAVTSSNEKAISKATTSLIKRIIAGLAVMFVPTLLLGIMDTIGLTDSADESYNHCLNCLLRPFASSSNNDKGGSVPKPSDNKNTNEEVK